MDMTFPSNLRSTLTAGDRNHLSSRVARLDADLPGNALQVTWQEFEALHRDIARCTAAIKGDLLDLGVAWSDDDRVRATWMHAIHERFAAVGGRVADKLRHALGAGDPRSLGATATALFYAGETVKSEVGVARPATRRYAALHALMRSAIASGHLRRPMRLEAGGRRVACTLETLYFRALLLARFSSGGLTCRQVEIFDAWIFMWSPALRGTAKPPAGSSLRVDLDSHEGLTRDAATGSSDSLFLLQEPIAKAFAEIRAQLQSGHIVPSDGCTAGFRVEDHIAVLDMMRRGLRQSEYQWVRAERTAVDTVVEVFLGLGEITVRGYSASGVQAAVAQLGIVGGRGRVAQHNPLDRIFDVKKRMARMVNTSETGLCLEGPTAEFGGISAGDLIAVRTAGPGPLLLGKVVRCIASATPGLTIIGVRRMSSRGCQATVYESDGQDAEPVAALFVSGEDATGRYDGYLVSEREFEKRAPLEARLGAKVFGLRFNRVRERGRGWILAGFEISGVRPAAPVLAAA